MKARFILAAAALALLAACPGCAPETRITVSDEEAELPQPTFHLEYIYGRRVPERIEVLDVTGGAAKERLVWRVEQMSPTDERLKSSPDRHLLAHEVVVSDITYGELPPLFVEEVAPEPLRPGRRYRLEAFGTLTFCTDDRSVRAVGPGEPCE